MFIFLWIMGGFLGIFGFATIWGDGAALLAGSAYCIASWVYMERRGWV